VRREQKILVVMSFQNLVRLSQIKKFPCLILPISTQVSKNMMIGYDIYGNFLAILQWNFFHCVKGWFERPVFFARDSTIG
jgi:hypothetical protein